MKLIALIFGILLLIFVEILRVYFIMPFPGSQTDEVVDLAYFLQNNIWWIRIIGLGIIAFPVWHYFKNGSRTFTITMSVVLGFYGVVFYMFNYKALADKMFLPMKTSKLLDAGANKKIDPKQLIIGVNINGTSRAYPIQIIGYHHQVSDTLSGVPIIVTYCTVCRTGRVFSPMVDGKLEKFRLVGMDHFNAMFEDQSTKSWWRQVNGEAITGPLKGKKLGEIPSSQMSLSAWLQRFPNSLILQPDSAFKEAYHAMRNYDKGRKQGDLTRRDSTSWNEKSWIVGLQIGMDARAYDWNDLQKLRVINDKVGDIPVLVVADPDSSSFYSFNRKVDQDELTFSIAANGISDSQTNSAWNWQGQCVEGSLKGKSLVPIQSYQEYWHSWRTFRPQTTKFVSESH